MSITGEDLINIVAKRLNEEGIPPTDGKIVLRLRELTWQELFKIIHLGDLERWHNDRTEDQVTGEPEA